MDSFHYGSEAVLWIGIAVIGYFLRDLIKTNKEQHRITGIALENISRRIKSDDEILAVVNGKYISRRETDLLSKESDLTHRAIVDKIAITDGEIRILREHWHGRVLDVLNSLSARLERQ